MKIFLLSALFLVFASASFVSGQKMKAEDVVAKHLESIGTEQARKAVKSMISVGDAKYKIISKKNIEIGGRVVLASAAEKNFFGMNLEAADYQMDKLSFDGSKVKASFVRQGQRSLLGNFILSSEALLKESLLGGTLSTSWALLDMANKKAELSYDGTKKIDGKETYVLKYTPKSSDLNIRLYFEKETFRHVRTEYKQTFSAGIGRNPNQSAGYDESRLTVTEDFGDFKKEKDLTLPHNYRLNYSVIGQNGTSEVEWTFALTEFAFNPTLDDKTFDAEAK